MNGWIDGQINQHMDVWTDVWTDRRVVSDKCKWNDGMMMN